MWDPYSISNYVSFDFDLYIPDPLHPAPKAMADDVAILPNDLRRAGLLRHFSGVVLF